MEGFGDTVPKAVCLFSFLKSLLPSNKQSGGMKAGCQRGKVTKSGEVGKIHCCLSFWAFPLGAWAQVESSHLAPGGHGPLSPSPVVTLAELVIFFPASGHSGLCPFLAGSRATVVLLLV